jgi:cell division protease FtsH
MGQGKQTPGEFVNSALSNIAANIPARRNMLAAGLTALGLAGSSRPAFADDAEEWSAKNFSDALDRGSIEFVQLASDSTLCIVTDSDKKLHRVRLLPQESVALSKTLQQKNVSFTVENIYEFNFADAGLEILQQLSNIAPFLFLLFLSSRSQQAGGGGMGGGMGGMGQIGKSKSKIQMEPNTGVTFKDVAGCDGAKLELTEVVDFLKSPAKYSALGAKIPKGVIMEGPPGTGKTLMAKAIAGEAGVPFLSASGSEFVEMYVGVGAARVRDLFGQAKKNAPCIVFIDEIDAIGRQRASGQQAATNDEREQTLNQILTEMDGFEGNTGVIVIAATNRADVLDNALVRPGRFDRRVPIDLPDVKGRRQVLDVHIRGKPLAKDVDLDIVAKRTIGFSGASLKNLMNEAAIVSARNNKQEIGYKEIDYAIDRITVGMQKTTGMKFKNRQRLVAYHEAGHATMGLLMPDYDMVTKVTIIPRTSGAGGFTLFTPPEERMDGGMYSKKYLCSQLAVALGGRVAEELIYGEDEVTTGASNDLQQVRSIARRMVAQWGFANDKMGFAPVAWESPDGNSLQTSTASDKVESRIDEQVKILVKCAYDTTVQTLTENRALLDYMTERLIEEETIDYNQLQEMKEKLAVKYPVEPIMPPEAVMS